MDDTRPDSLAQRQRVPTHTAPSPASLAGAKSFTITRPDDWHVHLRDGAQLVHTVADVSRVFGRAIVMPNLRPPITTVELAREYRERILAQVPDGRRFEPLMTLYLTDNTEPSEIQRAKECGFIHGVKLYPAGATTNSDAGVTAIRKVMHVLEAMEKWDIPLQLHGEVTGEVDVFDREAVFLQERLPFIIEEFPDLRIVLEHITTTAAADFVDASSGKVAATITAHHLLLNRNDMLVGGIKPHLYCLPILKRSSDQASLIRAATSGNLKFFLGTDSAPHAKSTKETAVGCAGTYTAHAALELYAEVFDRVDRLHRLQGFASEFGPQFYGLPPNEDRVTLVRGQLAIYPEIRFGDDVVVPLRAGGTVEWRCTA